jgi:hypothetical protein
MIVVVSPRLDRLAGTGGIGKPAEFSGITTDSLPPPENAIGDEPQD